MPISIPPSMPATLEWWWEGAGPADVAALRAAMESLPVAVMLIAVPPDRPTEMIAYNNSFARLVGGEPPRGPDHVARMSHGLYGPDRSRRLPLDEWPGTRAVRAGAPVRDVEVHVRRRDGTWRVASATAIPLPREDPDAAPRAVVVLLDVTERWRAAELQRRYELVAGHMRDAIVVSRRDGVIVEVNEAALRQYGYTREELLGMHLGELRHDRDGGAVARAISAADGGDTLFATVHRRKDGSPFPVEVSARAAVLDGAQVILGVVRDITERVRADAALREREARFRALVDQSRELVITSTADGTATYASAASLEMFGVARDEVVGRRAQEFVHPDDLPRVEAAFAAAAVTAGARARYEVRIRHRDGGWRTIDVTARNLLDVPGVEAMVMNVRDVTAERDAEARARRAQRALLALSQANEATARAASEQEILDAVCRVLVETGGYRMCWVGAVEHDERSAVRPLARAGHDDGYVDGLDLRWGGPAASPGPLALAIRTGRPQIARDFLAEPDLAPWHGAARSRGYRSVATFPLEVRGAAVAVLCLYASEPDAFDGEELGFLVRLAGDASHGLGALRERAERARAEAELRASRQQLRALAGRLDAIREEEKARIARDLHDELGQLLTALRVDLDTIEERLAALPASAAVGELADRALDASGLVGRAVTALREVLSVLRPAALDHLGLGAALRQEARRFEERTRIACTLRLPEPLVLGPEVETAFFRIAQEALTNVARHAAARQVEVSVAFDDGHAVLRVEDDGAGIGAPATVGRGLGIVGMSERAARLGGALAVVPGPAGGTVVTARVPLSQRGGGAP